MSNISSEGVPQGASIIISTRGEDPHVFARNLRDSIHEVFLIATERRELDLGESATYGINMLTALCMDLEQPRVIRRDQV